MSYYVHSTSLRILSGMADLLLHLLQTTTFIVIRFQRFTVWAAESIVGEDNIAILVCHRVYSIGFDFY